VEIDDAHRRGLIDAVGAREHAAHRQLDGVVDAIGRCDEDRRADGSAVGAALRRGDAAHLHADDVERRQIEIEDARQAVVLQRAHRAGVDLDAVVRLLLGEAAGERQLDRGDAGRVDGVVGGGDELHLDGRVAGRGEQGERDGGDGDGAHQNPRMDVGSR
jgi:hypothetical protein